MNTILIAKNSAWLFLGRVATALLNLLLTITIARTLGEAGFGQYTFIISLAYLGNTATTFGMDTLVMRAVSAQEESASKQAAAALWLQLGFSALYIFIIAIGSLFWQTPQAPLIVYLLILLPLAFGTVFSAILRGLERMDLHTAYTLTQAILQIVGAWWVLRVRPQLLPLVVILVLGQLVATCLAGWFVRRGPVHVKLQSVSADLLKRTYRSGWVLALIALLATLLAQLPILALRALTDDVTVGQFGVANQLINGARLLPAALFGALFPAMVRGANRDPRYAQIFWGLVGLFAVGITVGIFAAGPIIRLLFAGYAASIPVLQIMLLSLLPFLFRLRDSFELITQGDERPVLWATAVTVAIAIPLTVFAICFDPLTGAAVSVVAALLVHAITLAVAKRNISR